MSINQLNTCNNQANKSPVVSVVMAVHQGVQIKYLKEAVSSVWSQDFSDFEFLIVVDGPLDSEQESFLTSQQLKDRRTTIHRLKKNSGPGAARNVAILQAKGRYVAIMDSDDISLPVRLGIEVSFLDSHTDIAIVGSSCNVINEEGKITGYRHLPEEPKSLRRYALFFCPLNNPTIMARTKLIREYLYDEKWRDGEDYRLWLRLLAADYKIANIRESLVKFRVDSQLYKRRVGYQKGKSDLMHRLYALRITPVYMMIFVVLFAIITFSVRFMPHWFVKYLTTARDYFHGKGK